MSRQQDGLPHCWESRCGGLLGFIAPWHECGSVWASGVHAAVQFFLLCFCTRQSLAWRWQEEPHLGAGAAAHRHRLQTRVHQGSRVVLSGQWPATSAYPRMLVRGLHRAHLSSNWGFSLTI